MDQQPTFFRKNNEGFYYGIIFKSAGIETKETKDGDHVRAAYVIFRSLWGSPWYAWIPVDELAPTRCRTIEQLEEFLDMRYGKC